MLGSFSEYKMKEGDENYGISEPPRQSKFNI